MEKLIKSADIKVYPCAYRNSLFDIEAKLNTENNIRRTAGVSQYGSYILNYSLTNNELTDIEFVIDGYYFKINNANNYLTNTAEGSQTQNWYAVIQLASQDIGTVETSRASTYYLDSIVSGTEDTADANEFDLELDAKSSTIANFNDLDANTYYFTGLKLVDSISQISGNNIKTIQLVKDGRIFKNNLLPRIGAGAYDNSVLIGSTQRLNIETNRSDGSLIDGAANQIIVGKYNTPTNKEGAFVVGDGDAAARHTILEAYNGAVNINGNVNFNDSNKSFINNAAAIFNHGLTINGTTSSNNTLQVNGATTITGNTALGDSLTVSGATTLGSSLDVAGNTSLSDTLTVGKATKLNGTLTVSDVTTLNNNLTVSGGHTTNLDGTLTVSGKTTLNNNLTVAKDALVEGILSTTSTVNLVVDRTDSDTTITATFTTDGITFNKPLTVSGDNKATFGGQMEITGSTTLKDTLTVAGLTTVSDIKINDHSTVSGTINTASLVLNGGTFNNVTIMSGSTFAGELKGATGSITCSGTFSGTVTGRIDTKDGTFRGTLSTSMPCTTGNLTISTGDLTISKGSLSVNGTGSVTAGSFNTTGSVTAGSFYATSDRRLKENIEDYVPLKSILDLPIKSFNFRGTKQKQIGCIAQDLQKICPEMVNENSDGYLSIQENKLIYLLLGEVKKLKAELDGLIRKESLDEQS